MSRNAFRPRYPGEPERPPRPERDRPAAEHEPVPQADGHP